MLKDPLLTWPTGTFPYDALAAANITPASDMRQVMDAIYVLVEQGFRTTETELAWDELRIAQKRLWVDLFLYRTKVEEILATVANTWEQLESELLTKHLDALLKLDSNELKLLVHELEVNEQSQG